MRLSIVLMAGALAMTGAAGASDQISIPHGGSAMPGILYLPDGQGPFPSVIAMHGCAGLVNQSGKIFNRLNDWGERLAATGIAVLFPDSFSSRGLSTQCRV